MSIPFENIFHQIDMDLTSDGQHLVDSLATGLVKDDPHRRRSEHSCVAHPSGPDRQLFLLDTLPPCVRATSASFRMAFSDLLHPPRTPMDWMALEELSILMYKMSIIHLHRQLWLAYLQSGTGTMRSLAKPRQQPVPSLATHKWPSQVTLLIRSESGAQATNSDEIGEQTTYTNFVHEYLSELDERTRYYRTQFNTVANQLPIYSEVVGYQLSTFLSKSALVSARLHFTARIALIRHVYTDHLLQLEIWQQRPRVDHVGSFFFVGRRH